MGMFDFLDFNTKTDNASMDNNSSFPTSLYGQQENPLAIDTGSSSFGSNTFGGDNSFGSSFNFGGSPTIGGVGNQQSFWGNAMGKNGWAAPAASLLGAAGNFYTGYQQNQLAQDSLDTQKQQFSDQFNIQKQLVNQEIMDRGTARYSRDPENNLTPEAYYEQNKLQ